MNDFSDVHTSSISTHTKTMLKISSGASLKPQRRAVLKWCIESICVRFGEGKEEKAGVDFSFNQEGTHIHTQKGSTIEATYWTGHFCDCNAIQQNEKASIMLMLKD